MYLINPGTLLILPMGAETQFSRTSTSTCRFLPSVFDLVLRLRRAEVARWRQVHMFIKFIKSLLPTTRESILLWPECVLPGGIAHLLELPGLHGVRPLEHGHQRRLQLILHLGQNIYKVLSGQIGSTSSEPFHAKMNPSSCLFRSRFYRILSTYWLAHFYLMKKSAKVLLYFGLNCGMWNSFLTNCNLSRIFGAQIGKKIWAHANRDPNKQEVGFIFAWSGSELWTLIKYSRSKIKNL